MSHNDHRSHAASPTPVKLWPGGITASPPGEPWVTRVKSPIITINPGFDGDGVGNGAAEAAGYFGEEAGDKFGFRGPAYCGTASSSRQDVREALGNAVWMNSQASLFVVP